jgi:hypothetical protein
VSIIPMAARHSVVTVMIIVATTTSTTRAIATAATAGGCQFWIAESPAAVLHLAMHRRHMRREEPAIANDVFCLGGFDTCMPRVGRRMVVCIANRS